MGLLWLLPLAVMLAARIAWGSASRLRAAGRRVDQLARLDDAESR